METSSRYFYPFLFLLNISSGSFVCITEASFIWIENYLIVDYLLIFISKNNNNTTFLMLFFFNIYLKLFRLVASLRVRTNYIYFYFCAEKTKITRKKQFLIFSSGFISFIKAWVLFSSFFLTNVGVV